MKNDSNGVMLCLKTGTRIPKFLRDRLGTRITKQQWRIGNQRVTLLKILGARAGFMPFGNLSVEILSDSDKINVPSSSLKVLAVRDLRRHLIQTNPCFCPQCHSLTGDLVDIRGVYKCCSCGIIYKRKTGRG